MQILGVLPVTHCYFIYGLSVSSNFAIPGLPEKPGTIRHADVCLELRDEPSWVREAENLPAHILRRISASLENNDPAFQLTTFGEGQYFRLAYSDGTRFVVNRDASRVWGTAGDGQTMEDLTTYLLGPVMGFLLRRRGTTALHASAVNIDGRSVALVGAAGAGKSTTAAALALEGNPVLCEDITPLKEKDGVFFVQAGYPRVCLWPESVNILFGRRDALPRLTPTWEKCYLPLDGNRASFAAGCGPLSAIYLLAPRESCEDAPRIEAVSSHSVLLDLVQNTYMNWLLDREQRASEFDVLTRLLARVPVRRIIPHRDPARIGALCEAILEDVQALPAKRMAAAYAAGR